VANGLGCSVFERGQSAGGRRREIGGYGNLFDSGVIEIRK
jgi:hypothetical protein